MQLTEEEHRSIYFALDDLGLEPTDDNMAQMCVFLQAMRIYQEREAKHLGLWKKQPISDTIHHMRSKLERTAVQSKQVHPDPDDALDLINYSAFAVRRMRGEGW